MQEETIPRLLVVEAVSADLCIFDYYLYPSFEVYAAMSGEEALKILKEMHFDCVIVDAALPDCKAEDLISTIQTHYGPLPAVLVNGMDDDLTQPVTPISGVSTYVNKDLITNQEMLEAVWAVIDHSPVLCSMINVSK